MPKTIPGNLIQTYQEAPDQVSIVVQQAGQDDFPITYLEMIERASCYATAYREAQIKPGEVIILILQHGPDLIYAFWGAILHGCIPAIMPFLTEKLSPERYQADLEALFSVTRPAAVLTYTAFQSDVANAGSANQSIRTILLSETIKMDTVQLTDFSFVSPRTAEDIAVLQHSSGTTGLQKGIALSHQAILNQLLAYGDAIQLSNDDVIVSWLPLYHDMGLIASFILPVLKRVPLILLSPFDWVRAPFSLLQAVSKYKGTLSWLPNFAFNFMAKRIRPRHIEGVDLSSWRAVINCSEPVKKESHDLFSKAFADYGLQPKALQTSYAMAENVFGVTQSDIETGPTAIRINRFAFISDHQILPMGEGPRAIEFMASGKPINQTQILIIGPGGEELPGLELGEIAIKSNCLFKEYYNRPETTQKAFGNNWYYTGDLGFIANGELFVTGRKKDMIIVGGKNIYPQDLETLIFEVDGVHPGRAVTFGNFNPKTGTEDVVVVVESDSLNSETTERLANSIRTYVTQNSAIALRFVHVVPPKWIIKTSSGKPARNANRDKYLAENTAVA
jgi:fatty-acyl-CoA synthase